MSMLDDLGMKDTERVAEFLAYHMSQETRHAMMAELPVAYAKMCPGVRPAVIIARVTDEIRAVRGKMRAAPTVAADSGREGMCTHTNPCPAGEDEGWES